MEHLSEMVGALLCLKIGDECMYQVSDIIFLQYRDAKTLEWIAEYFNVDVSTIKRNKKRLIYKI